MTQTQQTVEEVSEGHSTQKHGTQMYLSFRFRNERFALSVQGVNEILDPIEETCVPNAAAIAPALINVRGSVVPLVDIRTRLGVSAVTDTNDLRVLVLDLPIQGEETRLAIMVDDVDEVIEADPRHLETIPELGARWPAAYVEGIARAGEDLVTILNTETLFDPAAN